MNVLPGKYEVLKQLRQDILRIQGLAKPATDASLRLGIGPIEAAFPGGIFPEACIHEYVSYEQADSAATSGFICGLTGSIMQRGGLCVWVGSKRSLFPASLALFGIPADRVIFVDVREEKQALWAIEEALKCSAIVAVVGELRDLTFTQSRRLQLIAEQSRVTAFIHRYYPRSENITASVTRWKIRATASPVTGLPGIGMPVWKVELQKVRNGKPGTWMVEWTAAGFRLLQPGAGAATAPVISFGKTA